MFDLPDAKRVRRDDLTNRASTSPPPSPPPESAYPDAQKRLSALLNLEIAAPSQPPQQPSPDDQKNQGEDEEQEFEFRLFAAPAKPSDAEKKDADGTPDKSDALGAQTQTQTQTQKLRIRLRSPTPTLGAGSGEGRFVNPFRGWGYYFSAPGLLSGTSGKDIARDEAEAVKLEERRKQFADVAVSGEEMVRWAGVSWPGCFLPWKVTRLKREHVKLPKEEKGTGLPAAAITCVVETPERVPLSRKKPGKKRRIQLRKRAAVAERAKETEAEKRNRKNREKKIKRRQKAREQKAAAAANGGGGDGDAGAMDVDGEVSGDDSD
ncbi:hypothetical protein BJY04DRAFT_137062 [Aspergillus karnatakaensis]|uniref:DUF2011 domain-containing protein n=1 Tax=Aspergillus karnatakaensis TaxID=1810916 RepID=UPI003CCD7EC1